MPPLGTLLTGFAHERSSGALRVGRTGTIYLVKGRVTYMESIETPSVEDVLTARERVPAAALSRAQQEGGGDLLVEEGLLTRGELQYAVLGAILDAAFFLLPVKGARPKFRPGEQHWLGPQWSFEVPQLLKECGRRRERLEQVWPCAELDGAPVAPVPRLPGHRVVLSDLQWELLVHADRTATPLELARRLGRSAYSTLLAVRQLGAAGLLAPPKPERPELERPELERPELVKRTPRAVGAEVVRERPDLSLLIRVRKALEDLA